jgi:hypothetical protein
VVLNVDRQLTRDHLATQVGAELRTAIETHRSKSVD